MFGEMLKFLPEHDSIFYLSDRTILWRWLSAVHLKHMVYFLLLFYRSIEHSCQSGNRKIDALYFDYFGSILTQGCHGKSPGLYVNPQRTDRTRYPITQWFSKCGARPYWWAQGGLKIPIKPVKQFENHCFKTLNTFHMEFNYMLGY